MWNRWLAAALRAAGLGDHAPPLLQGMVEGKTVNDAQGRSMTVALLARRSRLHPGMRYIARGLNSMASPGNEIECEQIVWAATGSDSGWANYVWRRGTVPIWWGVELRQGGVGEADVVIPQHRPYRGVTRYFRRLQKRYMPDEACEAAIRAAGGGAGEMQGDLQGDRHVPVYCVNLLRCSMTKRNGVWPMQPIVCFWLMRMQLCATSDTLHACHTSDSRNRLKQNCSCLSTLPRAFGSFGGSIQTCRSASTTLIGTATSRSSRTRALWRVCGRSWSAS